MNNLFYIKILQSNSEILFIKFTKLLEILKQIPSSVLLNEK